MAHTRSVVTQGIVLKRTNIGEADRVVTLLTPDMGKIVCIAKGARKMNSSKRGILEPGNRIKVMLIPTSSMMILTQATLQADLSSTWSNLNQLRRLSQILEIVDRLLMEAESDPEIFLLVAELLEAVQAKTASDTLVREQLDILIQSLGFPSLQETKHTSINEYVVELAEHRLHSFEYLKVAS